MISNKAPHSVVMLGFANAQILDITGPLEVFGRAGRWLRDHAYTKDLAYSVEIVAPEQGVIETSSGIGLLAKSKYSNISSMDTLLIAGGIGYEAIMRESEILNWISRCSTKCKRIGSVCTGALILAKTGLLDGKEATTHWAYAQKLATATGNIKVDAEAIFIKNDNVYTSAGVTSGMDMALAMVEEDWGSEAALAVAQELVLYLKRPGGQSQFSRYLNSQQPANNRLKELQLWILENLDKNLNVDFLADRVGMSARSFARHFKKEIGLPPAKYVEKYASSKLDGIWRRAIWMSKLWPTKWAITANIAYDALF